MAILGGSPLGLIGVKSTPSRDGMSTFNAGNSRNVNVNKYNTGKPNEGTAKGGMVSLFSGGNVVKAWGNIKAAGTEMDSTGILDNFKGTSRSTLHNNDIYDTSVLNLIEKLSTTPARLRPSDFAYLKDLGRYPNNRLMIARRFGGAIGDDIIGKSRNPKVQALLITWKPEGEEFFEISFSEDWEDADADFTGIINQMGEDFLGKGAGSGMGAALGAIPLPGFTEGLQRKFMENLGIMKKGAGSDILPAGNPNLIKMAKKRKTVGQGDKGSGLKCSFAVKMVCEYEQKFISGIDPTIVWQDLLGTMLRFGTSKKSDYGLSADFVKKVGEWSSDPGKAVDFIAKKLESALSDITGQIQKIIDRMKEPEDEEERLEDEADEAGNLAQNFFDNLIADITSSVKSTVLKYKHDIMGVANALSGMPSTPWHITIGNPLRPMFCSGDMLVEDTRLIVGADLAFNDLPSKIRVEFTLKNSRPWGLGEIASKFNTGNIRTVNTVRDFSSLKAGQSLYNSPLENVPIPKTEPVGSGPGVSNTAAGVDNTNSGVTTENKEVEVVVPEAGSGSEPESVVTDGVTTGPTQEQAAAEAAAAAAAAAAAPVGPVAAPESETPAP